MAILPIQVTSPDQVQAPQKVGGTGGHKGKPAQANQMGHVTNAKRAVSDFKSQIARQLKESDNATISDESQKKDHGAGKDQPKKPHQKPKGPQQANSTEEASGLINVIV
ncbi:MAG: hypothetical protein P4L44_11035 [Oryzomonas sp.]|uniref:hypothetical protein n=1 Tax=Oryzomonas sp. TaxID=2855186 RepID=UPI0028519CA2|nr:hypothetical protein [Oryzomonas sp.]MDR3580486.1 hypothetical protein [Oryzomonas sp.]